MIVCDRCFKDREIKEIIKSLKNVGQCPTCGQSRVHRYDTEKDAELIHKFEGLVDVYTPSDELPDDYNRGDLQSLKYELCYNWDIFNLDTDKIYSFLISICKEKYKERPILFDGSVGIIELTNEEYIKNNSILKGYKWEDFVEEIKHRNRFNTDHINEDVLELFCTYVSKIYKEGTTFFRARISKDEEGYDAENMGAPPAELATAGRANPEGISYLYLASCIETACHEVRTRGNDIVSIAEFRLKEDIYVVDLTSVDKISAFSELDFTQHAINRKHLRKISSEIAKPLLRSGSALDYLPTQYICEYIKNIEKNNKKVYRGIEYKSTLYEGGYNITIFDENLGDESVFECINVDLYRANLHYSRNKLN